MVSIVSFNKYSAYASTTNMINNIDYFMETNNEELNAIINPYQKIQHLALSLGNILGMIFIMASKGISFKNAMDMYMGQHRAPKKSK